MCSADWRVAAERLRRDFRLHAYSSIVRRNRTFASLCVLCGFLASATLGGECCKSVGFSR